MRQYNGFVMENAKDLLTEWIKSVGLLKFKLHRPFDKLFTDAIETEKTLRAFFNKNDYTLSTQGINEDNYLIYLLRGGTLRDIHLLNEMATLIRYAETSNQNFQLKKKNNSVPHAGLSNALFEVQINMLLKSKGFKVQSNIEYIDKEGNKRPLDAYFTFKNEPYLVECYRIDEPVSRGITLLSQYLMSVSLKMKISASQAFVGHIGFKTDKNLAQWIDRARGKILELLKKYLKAFDTDGHTLAIPQKYTEEAFTIEILPYYMGTNHEQELKSKEHGYTSLVSFETKPKINRIDNFELIVSGARIISNKTSNEKLFQKIKTKLTQHKDVNFNKIYFIEIDTTFGINSNNPIFPLITKEQLDINRYTALINEQTILVLIFKKATDTGIKYELGFMNVQNYHVEVIEAFTKQELTLSQLGLVNFTELK